MSVKSFSELSSIWKTWEQSTASACGFLDWCFENNHLNPDTLKRFLPIRGHDRSGRAVYAEVGKTIDMYPDFVASMLGTLDREAARRGKKSA